MNEDEYRYRWANAREWLLEKIQEQDAQTLRAMLKAILPNADGEAIEDLFQADMIADGYFDPLCARCDEPTPMGQLDWRHGHPEEGLLCPRCLDCASEEDEGEKADATE